VADPEPAPVDMTGRGALLAPYDVASVRKSGEMTDLATFAAELCDAPVAIVALMDEDHQHFLAAHGTDLPGNPRELTFCTHFLDERGVAVVPDASRDPRLSGNPLVAGEPNLRFYAGAPMVTPEGETLGTVCVFDVAARDDLTPVQRHGLEVLAKAALGRLDDRRIARERREARARNRAALAASELRFRTLADTMPQMVWSALPDGHHDYYNARWYEFTGSPAGTTDGEGWSDMFHPQDRERARTRWRHSLDTGEPYEIEYRLRHIDGTYRWVLGRALPIRDDGGAVTRWFGTCTDIHEQKLAMEERELISQELSHRIKNIFAVIAGLVQFAARGRPEFAAAAADLRQRITALGRAHDFVRPHSSASRRTEQPGGLHGLLEDLFEAYQQPGERRVRVTGDDMPVDDRSATPLALLFHELATNATKYGALSVAGGVVTADVAVTDESVTITWTERGGPAITHTPEPTGFGSRLIELSAVRQLGGTVSRDWAPAGLFATVTIPAASFRRS
jgi:PAS domain S-box-containing protein